MDVEYEPLGQKLYKLGGAPKKVKLQALIGRFVNEEVCEEFYKAWVAHNTKKSREEA